MLILTMGGCGETTILMRGDAILCYCGEGYLEWRNGEYASDEQDTVI